MPSSMIFAGLVVMWLLILVPAVARHRQEVARPSVAALSGRVLERPRRRRSEEADVMNEVDQHHAVASRPGPEADSPIDEGRDAYDGGYAGTDDGTDDGGNDGMDEPADDRGWDRPPPRYRPGRGGFDPEAAALAASARAGFRQRVVLVMIGVALLTGLVAAAAVPGLWWPHAAVDLVLVGYLVYLRRQVRMEEAIRERRAARLAGTRHPPAAEDPEHDEWAGRGREVTLDPTHDAPRVEDGPLDHGEPGPATDAEPDTASASASDAERGGVEPALPRLQPTPPPPLPAGTALVEADDADPDLDGLDAPARPDYRRAAGQ